MDYFDHVIGHIEDIVISDQFQVTILDRIQSINMKIYVPTYVLIK